MSGAREETGDQRGYELLDDSTPIPFRKPSLVGGNPICGARGISECRAFFGWLDRAPRRRDRQASGVESQKGWNQCLMAEPFERLDRHGAVIGEPACIFEVAQVKALESLFEITHPLPFAVLEPTHPFHSGFTNEQSSEPPSEASEQGVGC